jgi:hypothetical protein
MTEADATSLNAERTALLDAFDAAWMSPCDAFTPRARRALACAQRLFHANCEWLGGNRIIFPGGSVTAPTVIRA